jgi:hypothetical protein
MEDASHTKVGAAVWRPGEGNTQKLKVRAAQAPPPLLPLVVVVPVLLRVVLGAAALLSCGVAAAGSKQDSPN